MTCRGLLSDSAPSKSISVASHLLHAGGLLPDQGDTQSQYAQRTTTGYTLQAFCIDTGLSHTSNALSFASIAS